MVILKKIKSSTLIEVITATVVIVVVFSLALMIMNNVMMNKIKSDTGKIETHLNELMYDYKNNKITIPYSEDYLEWNIKIEKQIDSEISWIVFDATKTPSGKKVSRLLVFEE